MEGGTMSSSTENLSSTAVMQEEGASAIPYGAGYAAPPPTPSSSCLPPHGVPFESRSMIFSDENDPASVPSTSTSTSSSPPSKLDLDALAQYLLQQSFHSTPTLLASPRSRQRKRCTSPGLAVVVQSNDEEDDHAVNRRNDLGSEKEIQTFSYVGGFSEESKRGMTKACQEVGAFYVLVHDAEEALSTLKCGHGVDGKSVVVEGRLVSLTQLLTRSTSPCHLHDDDLGINSSSFDSGIDTSFRDTITSFASLLSRVSKDVLKILLEDSPIATQSNIGDRTLKPLIYIHGNGDKQELNLKDDVVLFISHNIEIHKSESSALCLARLGPLLQTWCQGKYKSALMKTLRSDGIGEVCIRFALVQHY